MKLESTITEKAGFLYLSPMMDGVVLLLAFFILGSTNLSKSGVQVSLPASSSSLPSAQNCHIITVMQGTPPKLFFNDSGVDLAQLNAQLMASKLESNQVTILADRDVSNGDMMKVAVVALNLGYEVVLGTQPE